MNVVMLMLCDSDADNSAVIEVVIINIVMLFFQVYGLDFPAAFRSLMNSSRSSLRHRMPMTVKLSSPKPSSSKRRWRSLRNRNTPSSTSKLSRKFSRTEIRLSQQNWLVSRNWARVKWAIRRRRNWRTVSASSHQFSCRCPSKMNCSPRQITTQHPYQNNYCSLTVNFKKIIFDLTCCQWFSQAYECWTEKSIVEIDWNLLKTSSTFS